MSQTQAGERKKGWEGQKICSVLTWGHTGRLHTNQFGPVGEGRALSDRDSWLGVRLRWFFAPPHRVFWG